MKKFQVRNVDDALYQHIEQAAIRNERSVEGEVRFALREYYQRIAQPAEVTLSPRERWQQQTGQRLQGLLARLISDGFFRDIGSAQPLDMPALVSIADHLALSPGVLMDLIAGQCELTQPLAEQLASAFDASADWLRSGTRVPFSVPSIGNDYHAFFLPLDGSDGYVFDLIRIDGGLHDGTLFCLRYHPETRRYALGVVCEHFMLRAGMGHTGHRKLKEFLLFLKGPCNDLAINAFSWRDNESEEDFWQLFGQHHPVYFQNPTRRTSARWLQQLMKGEDPGEWFIDGWADTMAEVGGTEYGAATPKDKDHQD